MTLLPIPGAPGYRIDCENQVAYQFKGFLKKINARTKYKTVSLYIGGQTFVTTIYRMMWCAQHGADIMNSVIHYGRSENNRIRKESALVDDMQAIVIG